MIAIMLVVGGVVMLLVVFEFFKIEVRITRLESWVRAILDAMESERK